MQIRAGLAGGGDFDNHMRKIQKRMRDTKPFMKSLAIQTHAWILKNYRTSGGLLKGRKWAPLRPSTIAARRRGSKVPLRDRGDMMKAWNWRVSRVKAEIGNPMDIARYHEEGTGIYGPEHRRYVIKPVRSPVLAFPVAGYTVGKYGKAKKRSRLKMAVVKYVVHPGIRQRRQLPTEDEIMPDLLKVGEVWMKKAIK